LLGRRSRRARYGISRTALYELYPGASPITLDAIHNNILALADGDEASDPTATPRRDTIREVISGDRLPQSVRHANSRGSDDPPAFRSQKQLDCRGHRCYSRLA
jgi:hypothetical protein